MDLRSRLCVCVCLLLRLRRFHRRAEKDDVQRQVGKRKERRERGQGVVCVGGGSQHTRRLTSVIAGLMDVSARGGAPRTAPHSVLLTVMAGFPVVPRATTATTTFAMGVRLDEGKKLDDEKKKSVAQGQESKAQVPARASLPLCGSVGRDCVCEVVDASCGQRERCQKCFS